MSGQTFRNIVMLLMTFVPGILAYIAFHYRDEAIRAEREKEREMKEKNEKFVFDPYDQKALCDAMNKYGGDNTMYVGTNAYSERVTVSIYPDKIICVTYQHNGWVRKNTFYNDGSREETFDGRWKNIGEGKE